MTNRFKARARLAVEALERREVPYGISFNSATRTVLIEGGSLDDTARVQLDAGADPAPWDDKIVVTLSTGGVGPMVQYKLWKAPGVVNVKGIEFQGFEGRDEFVNRSYVPSFADGGKDDDYLAGGSAADVLVGGSGNDVLIGADGDDVLQGGDGDDELHGAAGNDVLDGEGGQDRLFGASGNDVLDGGTKDNLPDYLSGGTGLGQDDDVFYEGLFGGVNIDAPVDAGGKDQII